MSRTANNLAETESTAGPRVVSGVSPEPAQVPQPSVGQRGAVLRLARRLSVLVVGLSVVLVGIVMLVTPGPAVVVIPLGLGILATEFLWARRILDVLKRRFVAGQEMLPDWTVFRWMKRWLPDPSISTTTLTEHDRTAAPETPLTQHSVGRDPDSDRLRSAVGRRAG
ncbi:MAG: PGPGW domain-containing protein [Planctomycetes bacterium]|nr:PGPGW domain-containing protein [Planctomycetota bacterium]